MEVLAIIGLVVGLVVLLVVIRLLNNTLKPLREILADVQGAHAAPLIERGVPGTEQLAQTRRLADSVPPLAMAYLQKISGGIQRAPEPAAASQPPAPGPAPAAAPEQSAAQSSQPEPPAWKKYITK